MIRQMICTGSYNVGTGELEHPLSYDNYSENSFENPPNNKFENQLRTIEGITNYQGICGGGTQHLYILSKLLEKNDIDDIQLIDINPQQLENFKKISNIYNTSGSDEEYMSALRDHCNGGWDIYSLFKENTKKPIFDENINVNLIHTSVEEHIEQINTKGKYFIYLSIIPYDTELDLIKRKDIFNEGTIVFTVGDFGMGYTMYEKKGNDLEILFQE